MNLPQSGWSNPDGHKPVDRMVRQRQLEEQERAYNLAHADDPAPEIPATYQDELEAELSALKSNARAVAAEYARAPRWIRSQEVAAMMLEWVGDK